jgi:hypothetical protein
MIREQLARTGSPRPHSGLVSRNGSGQALVEFLITATLVLIPMFLVIPLLGKYMDMKATAIQAARYAAWERTVWFGHADWAAGQKTDLQIQHEVQWRFFSNNATAKLQASDGGATGWAGGPKALWRDRAGYPMLVNYDSDVTQSRVRGETPGLINDILDPVVSAISTVGSILGAAFVLDMDSLYTATVNVQTVQTVPIKQVLNAGAATGAVAPMFSERNVLIANGWSANGAAQVKAQTEGLTPTSFFQRSPLSDILTIIQWVSIAFAPELNPNHLKLGGEIKPDIVPDDRLQ